MDGRRPARIDRAMLAEMFWSPKTVLTKVFGMGLVALLLGVVRLCLTTRLWGLSLGLLLGGFAGMATGWTLASRRRPGDRTQPG
jgi:hypothetical protein